MSQANVASEESLEKREDRRLSSWKEIAAYFGHDQRTVKRWEHSRGLPVRRLPGSRGHVFALVSEVEAWQRGELVKEAAVEQTAAGPETAPLPAPEKVSAPVEIAEVSVSETSQVASPVSTQVLPAEPSLRASKSRNSHATRLAWTVAAFAGGCAAVLLAVSLPGMTRHSARAEEQRAYVPVPQAKELYLQGRFRWSKRTPEDLKAAMEDFQEAVKIDPGFAPAYAGMADVYALVPQFAGQYQAGVLPQMLKMAHTALQLDPNLPEAHRALAFAEFYWQWDREGSRAEFEKAIALAPQDATAHLWFANTLATEGQADQGVAEVERARELNPTEPAIVADRGWVLMKAGRLEEARAALEALETTNPENRMAPLWLAGIALQQHRPEEFLKQLETNARLCGDAVAQERLTVAQRGFRNGGEKGMSEALARLAVEQADKAQISPYEAALELTAGGRSAEAIAYLNKALQARDISAQALLNPRELAALHGTPEFEELVKRLGPP